MQALDLVSSLTSRSPQVARICFSLLKCGLGEVVAATGITPDLALLLRAVVGERHRTEGDFAFKECMAGAQTGGMSRGKGVNAGESPCDRWGDPPYLRLCIS